MAWLSAATAYLNDKGCSLRQKQYSFIEEDLICLSFLLQMFQMQNVAFSWVLSCFLNKSAPKEKVLSPLLCQNTAEETNCRVDVLGKSVQEEPMFVLQHKAMNDSLRQKEYGL